MFTTRLLVIITSVVFVLPSRSQAQTPGPGCGVFTPAEVSALVGKAVTAVPGGRGCTWRDAGEQSLLLRVMGGPGMASVAENTFKSARTALVSEKEVTTESGIGDSAYSHPTSGGAVFAVMKGGQLIQLVLRTERDGTAKDVDGLRALARKVVAAMK